MRGSNCACGAQAVRTGSSAGVAKAGDEAAIGGELFCQSAHTIGGKDTTAFNIGAIYDIDDRNHLLFSAGRALRQRICFPGVWAIKSLAIRDPAADRPRTQRAHEALERLGSRSIWTRRFTDKADPPGRAAIGENADSPDCKYAGDKMMKKRSLQKTY